MDGITDEVINSYISVNNTSSGSVSWHLPNAAPGNKRVRLLAVSIESDGRVSGDVSIDQDVRIQIDFANLVPGLKLSTSIHLLDKVGTEVLASANFPSANLGRDEWYGRPFPSGSYRATCVIPRDFLNEGHYSIRVALLSDASRIEFLTQEIIGFTIHDSGEMRREYSGHWLGVVRPRLAWTTVPLAVPAAP
jgi:lipopolysaccharide transport system ATP-binding protein